MLSSRCRRVVGLATKRRARSCRLIGNVQAALRACFERAVGHPPVAHTSSVHPSLGSTALESDIGERKMGRGRRVGAFHYSIYNTPAVDILWKDFRRPLLPADYSRFLLYASRVRVFDCHLAFRYQQVVRARVAPDVWNALHAFRPMVYLLPNLRKVVFSWTNDTYDEQEGPLSLQLLLSPRLRHVDLWFTCMRDDGENICLPRSIEDACTQYLACLGYVLKDMRHFRFSILGKMPPIRTLLVDLVTEMNNLTHISLQNVVFPPPVFLHLANLQQLSHMFARIRVQDWSEKTRARLRELRRKAFPTLNRLIISIDDISLYYDIQDIIQSSEMTSISLFINDIVVTELAACIATLPHQPFAAQMRSIELHPQLVDESLPPILYAHDLEPLLRLDLRSLSIYGCEIAIYDELLHDMSEAWPNIQTLSFSGYSKGICAYSVTLPGLLPLVYNCPALQSLSIQVDASFLALPLPIPEVRPAFGKEQRSLLTIGVHYGRITNPAFVAGFLADCFPQCTRVYSSWPLSREEDAVADPNADMYARMWFNVCNTLPHFAKIRAQERAAIEKAGRKVRGPAAHDVLQYVDVLPRNPVEAARIASYHARW